MGSMEIQVELINVEFVRVGAVSFGVTMVLGLDRVYELYSRAVNGVSMYTEGKEISIKSASYQVEASGNQGRLDRV